MNPISVVKHARLGLVLYQTAAHKPNLMSINQLLMTCRLGVISITGIFATAGLLCAELQIELTRPANRYRKQTTSFRHLTKENLLTKLRLQPPSQQRKPVPALCVVLMQVVQANNPRLNVAQDRLADFVRATHCSKPRAPGAP